MTGPPARPQPLPQPRVRSRRQDGGDDEAVSEVVGAILVFGILSMVLVTSMIAFRAAETDVRDRVVGLRAEAISDRIAGIIVQASLFAEHNPGGGEFAYPLDLDQQLEGRDFTIAVIERDFDDPEGDGTFTSDCDDIPAAEPACDAQPPDRVRVSAPGIAFQSDAALFSASAPTGLSICNSVVPGGPMWVRYGTFSNYDPDGSGPIVASSPDCLFLETA